MAAAAILCFQKLQILVFYRLQQPVGVSIILDFIQDGSVRRPIVNQHVMFHEDGQIFVEI